MAALNRPTEATYVTHEEVTVDTSDHEDHTFCGIMFPVKCKELLPVDHVVIRSVAVRGRLGPLTVWVSSLSRDRGFRMNPRHWTKIYQRTHASSFHSYVELDFEENAIRLQPGQCRAIYIHSTLPGDEAIVYDNRHSQRTYDDNLISILSGRAHVSTTPFGTNPIWGWGNPWRDQREFVGRLNFGAVYRLWNPQEFHNFGGNFQKLARTLFLCQRRFESPWSKLPDDCIFYILNMCRWDWANDTQEDMREVRRIRRSRAAEEEYVAAAAPLIEAARAAPAEQGQANQHGESVGRSCCIRQRSGEEQSLNSSDDEEYHVAREDQVDDDDDEDEVVDYAEDEDFEVMSEDDLDVDDVDEESEDDWEDDDGYNANDHVFEYHDDSEEEEDNHEAERSRRAWIHRQFARIHILQALAVLDDNGVEHMHH